MKSIAVAIVIWGIALCAISHAINPPALLIDHASKTILNDDVEKLVILVHGWTGSPESWTLDNGKVNLTALLAEKLENTGWGLVSYDWQDDAAVGGDPTIAAGWAKEHGEHFASRMIEHYSKIRKVHVIAHSAGAWFGYGLAKSLLGLGDASIQVTLLDPFAPDFFLSTEFTEERMGDLDDGWIEDLYRLENYYVTDGIDFGFLGSTEGDFNWRSSDIQRDVGWDSHYGGHSGPILFYNDTVLASAGMSVPGLFKPGADLADIGWKSSMFYNEPVFDVEPKGVSAQVGEWASLTTVVTTRSAPSSSPSGLHLQWQEKPPRGSWRNRPEASSTLVVGPVTSEMNGTLYRAIATLNGLTSFSKEAHLDISNATTGSVPAVPGAFDVQPVSTTQINLSWAPSTSTASGYDLKRWPKLAPAEWVMRSLPHSATRFSDTGLTPNTDYVYQIRARSSQGPSEWSGQIVRKTHAPPSASFALKVDGVDLGVNQSVAISIYSWVGRDAGFRSDVSPFIRSVSVGESLTVSAPESLPGSRYFQYWLEDGTRRHFTSVASITMNQAHNMIAVYGNAAPTVRIPVSLSIEGPAEVDERESATYKARAKYSDGSYGYVAPQWEESSSYVSVSSRGVLDAGAVSSDKTAEIRASVSVNGTTRNAAKEVKIRNRDAVESYTLSLEGTHGHITPSPDLNSYAKGAVVRLTAYPDDDYLFSSWSGAASGSERSVYVTMTGNKTVTAHFALDTRRGSARVNLEPAAAVSEGAAWKLLGKITTADWQPDGDEVGGRPPGRYTVTYKSIPGWITPENMPVEITGGGVVEALGTYREILGSAQVVISPPAAVTAGARWRVVGGMVWRESGQVVPELAPGTATVEFQGGLGWVLPPPLALTVQRGQTSVHTVSYVPPVGQPLVAALFPRSGPIEGGTVVSIEGANFSEGCSVKFDGVTASSVVVLSSTHLTAVVPERAVYGSVDVEVVSNSGRAVVPNGFDYDIPLGMNMKLLSQLGGIVRAVAVSGNLVLYGEGCSLVAADFTNSSAPVVRGRIALPGMVNDIQIVGNHALVANGGWGLQIVDISNPAAMGRRGFFDTPVHAQRLAVSGNLCFVADQAAVLQVIDFTDRAAPFLAASYNLPEAAWDVVLIATGGRQLACVAANYAGVYVLDVTNPHAMSHVTTLEAGTPNMNISASGTSLLVNGAGASQPEGRVYSLVNPETPLKIHVVPDPLNNGVSLLNGGYAYTASGYLHAYSLASPVNPGTLSFPGDTYDLALSGSLLYMANGRGGLIAVNVSSSTAPSLRATLNHAFHAGDVVVEGQTAYVAYGGSYSASSSSGLAVFTVMDVTDRQAPQRLATATWTGTLERIFVGSGILLGSTQSKGVPAFNVQSSQSPQFSSVRFASRTFYSAARMGDRLLLGEQNGNQPQLTLVDGWNLSQVNPISTLPIPNSSGLIRKGLATHDRYAYAVINDAGLKVVDYGNPLAPQIVGSAPHAASVEGVATSGDGRYLFVADRTYGLSIFDCQTKTAPVLLTRYARNNFKLGMCVAVQGHLVYYGDTRGVNVLDCSNPVAPLLVGSYDTPGTPYALYLADGDVFVADNDAGIEILRLGDISRPLVEILTPTANAQMTASVASVTLSGSASDAQGITTVTWTNERGGGGVATGTSTWSTGAVSLQPGENRIAVVATDSSGNTAKDEILIFAEFPDTTPPVIAIGNPAGETLYATEEDEIEVSGSAVDNRGLAAVTWQDDRGSSGIASLGENGKSWAIASLALLEGPSKLTVTATDLAGNSNADSVVILKVPADAGKPTVDITFPTPHTGWSTHESTINLAGSAGDDRKVTVMQWSNQHGDSGGIPPSATWAANGLTLRPGMNVITIEVTDAQGNSAEDTLLVEHIPLDADSDGLLDSWEMLSFGRVDLAGAMTDAGGNGNPDLLDYALGLDPLDQSRDGSPKTVIIEKDGQSYLGLKYRQRMRPGALQYLVGVSEDLQAWDFTEQHIERWGLPVPTGDGETEEVIIRLLKPIAEEQRKFLRVKVGTME